MSKIRTLDLEATLDVTVTYEYEPGDMDQTVTPLSISPPDQPAVKNVRVYLESSLVNGQKIDITGSLTKSEYNSVVDACIEDSAKPHCLHEERD